MEQPTSKKHFDSVCQRREEDHEIFDFYLNDKGKRRYSFDFCEYGYPADQDMPPKPLMCRLALREVQSVYGNESCWASFCIGEDDESRLTPPIERAMEHHQILDVLVSKGLVAEILQEMEVRNFRGREFFQRVLDAHAKIGSGA